MTENVYWLITMSINDGKLDDFRRLAKDMCAATEQEEGALAYEWFLSEDRATCHIYERYADNAAVMAHLANFGKVADQFMACVTPTGITVYGPADDTVRGALASFGAVHYAQFAGFTR